MSADLLYAIQQQISIANKWRGSLSGTNAFFYTTTDKQVVKSHNTACYARLKGVVTSPLYLIDFPMVNRGKWPETSEVQKPFMDYMMNRSPYKDIFLLKDVEHALQYGFLCDTTIPSNLLIGGLTVMRSLWEYTYIPLRWKELVDLGVNEDMALLAAHCISGRKGSWTFTKQGSGHRAFEPDTMSRDVIKNFLKRKMANPQGSLRDTKTYSHITALWGTGLPFFSLYIPKIKKVKEVWGEKVVYYFDSTLEPFAEWLKVEYADIMGLDKPPVKKAPKKTAKKRVRKSSEHPLIALITVRNGFTLGEVREIRKNLRELIVGGAMLGLRARFDTINHGLVWAVTPQGHAYWNSINNTLARNNVRGHYVI